jgi:ADP-ribosylglycohydrolase
MKMPGGGTFGLNAGQLTDDSELALQLGYALS